MRGPADASRSRSAATALFLSFLWPGVGQYYLGKRRAAVIFAVPAVVLALLLLWEARDGAEVLLARVFLVPTAALVLVILTILLALWRLASMTAAMVDAPRVAVAAAPRPAGRASPMPSRRTATLFAVLAAVVLLTHGLLAWTGLAFLQAGSQIFVTDGGPPAIAVGPTSSQTSGAGSMPTTYAPPPPPSSRINVLVIGSDGGLGYDHSLTDSMIVVSVDQVSDRVAMISLPRDIAQFRLYTGGTFSGKLNSLVTYASDHPAQFPAGGLGTLTREIGFLLGIQIPYYAYVNLAGFNDVIDLVGGIDIVNPAQISDAGYEFPDGAVGFYLSAGPHHLNGRLALAYVRSREGPGDNDFTRARRQQEVLIALRDRLTDPSLLPNLPGILQALAKTVQTDYPPGSVPDLIQLAPSIPAANVSHYVLGPPYATQPAVYPGQYELVINQAKFEAFSIGVFGADSAFFHGTSSPTPVPTP